MRIGYNLLMWTTHVTAAHRPIFRALKAAGYDGVEIPVFEGAAPHFAELGRMLADEGLVATALGIVPDAARNPIAEAEDVRAAGVGHLKWLVDCARALGAEVLCGPYHSPLGLFSGRGPTDAERARLVASLQAMSDHAGPGLTLAVEPLNRFECYALNTCAQAADLIAEVGRAGHGYLYDTFHANIEERDPVGALAATAAAVSHVHVSENDRGTLGRGHVPLAETIAALRAAGYGGWLVIEAFGQALPDLAAATRVWRPLFGNEEEAYGEGLAAVRRALAA